MSQLENRQDRERILFCSAFCLIRALNRLEETHPQWGGRPALLSLPIKTFVSSRIQTHPRKLLSQISGPPVARSYGIETGRRKQTVEEDRSVQAELSSRAVWGAAGFGPQEQPGESCGMCLRFVPRKPRKLERLFLHFRCGQ